MRSNVYYYGNDLVAAIHDDPNSRVVLVKFLSGRNKDAKISVLRGKLTKSLPQKVIAKPQTGCPTCKTPEPNYIKDLECPGCGFKEWLAQNKTI